MDLTRQYIVQCVQTAANNLRLSSEKIEVVALLREHLSHSDNLEKQILNMKKVTEFSKFAIRLGELYHFISTEKIDFLKLSDKFKEHSASIVRELNYLLDLTNPQIFREKLNQIQTPPEPEKKIVNDLPDQIQGVETEAQEVIVRLKDDSHELPKVSEKEKFIMDELKTEDTLEYENYEMEILRPIKKLDSILERIARQDYAPDDLNEFIDIMQTNCELSRKQGFSILTDMHKIFYSSLELLKTKELLPVIPVIEGMRACLIVIVALVRSKDVDITHYLTRAENFGKQIIKN